MSPFTYHHFFNLYVRGGHSFMSYRVTAFGLGTTAIFNDLTRAYAFRNHLIKLGYPAIVEEI